MEDVVCPEDPFDSHYHICPPEDGASGDDDDGMIAHNGVDDWCLKVGEYARSAEEYRASSAKSYGEWLGSFPGIHYDSHARTFRALTSTVARTYPFRTAGALAFRFEDSTSTDGLEREGLVESAQQRVDR